jgi:uncharacterized protein
MQGLEQETKQSLLYELMQQAEQLTSDEQLQLSKHLEWLATRRKPVHSVGYRLEEIQAHREEILKIMETHGAGNVRIFGSMARGEARSDSDVDFLVDASSHLSAWFPIGLIQDLEELLGRRVDVVTVEGLKERMRDRILAEAVPL